MPEPLEFQIVQSLQTALKGIKASAGYHYTVDAMAVKLDPDHDIEALITREDAPFATVRPFILLDLSAPDAYEYVESPSRVRVLRPFTIAWVHESDPTDDDSLLETYFRGLADVETAIAADITRGGLATDTRILSREMRQPDGGRQVWALVAGQIRSRRTYGAPNG